MDKKTEELMKVKDQVVQIGGELADMRREGKYYPVIGEGSHDASIMFVGEAPGENEAKTGRPFVGRAGKLLDELLASVDIPREVVYITNIVKDRPPKNRDPLPDEIAIYAPYLDKQVEIIKPKVIATLGRFSMQYVMNRYGLDFELGPISELHGKVFDTTVSGEPVKVVALFHPAAAIYNQHLKPQLVEDFKVLKTIIA
ncbi:uracil-DNA glycosylase [Candidatus Parcubacteria bacterium]|nr:uracil-DNA glycosylase [Candidatus Parcubacteria bacterium]